MYKYERKYLPTWVTYICILLMISLLGNTWLFKSIYQLEAMDKEDAKAYQLLSNQYENLENKYEILRDEYNELYESSKWISLGEFKITHYGSDCIGCIGRTATGTIPTLNKTIATDWDIIPPGTEVMINGIIYTVEDKGGAIKGNKIDIYVGTESLADDLGVYYTEVYIRGVGGKSYDKKKN